MTKPRWWLLAALMMGAAGAQPAWAQTAISEILGFRDEKKPSVWDEVKLFSYIENSYTFNLGQAGRDATNELRFYDFDEGYTFNMAELSIKKDPTEAHWWGFGLVTTAGLDAQKNHSLGLFRDKDDTFPFRNTRKFDLQEGYLSARIPVGNGLVVKGGKFVTLLGYEVIESPNNLNFSRGYLFSLAIPLTHTGGLLSYQVTDWFTATAGVVLGWDNSKDNNDRPSYTGQFAFTPIKDLTASLNWIAGPEQNGRNSDPRYVVDVVAAYTGFKGFTIAANIDYGHEVDEAFLASLGTRRDISATWWGMAGYLAYDFTEKFRMAFRLEYFQDVDGARTGLGQQVDLVSATLTAQYKIWKGLVGRAEFRHDQASDKIFSQRVSRPDASNGITARGNSLNTISLSLYYQFF